MSVTSLTVRVILTPSRWVPFYVLFFYSFPITVPETKAYSRIIETLKRERIILVRSYEDVWP